MKLLLHPSADIRVKAIAASPGGTVLLYGAQGTGKRTIAKELARQLNCLGCKDDGCRACRMVLGGNHPDVITVEPDEKNKIGIEQVHQLQHDLHYGSYEPGSRRVVLIFQSHRLTLPAQNALLKGLEEPPAGTTVILTSENLQALLPTVVSRCRTVHIPLVSDEDLARHLSIVWPGDQEKAQMVTKLSQGAAGLAITLMSDKETLERHKSLMAETTQLLEASDLFEKLKLASAMVGDYTAAYVSMLTAMTRNYARKGNNPAALKAVERLRQRLSANVSPKTAFEALAVELA